MIAGIITAGIGMLWPWQSALSHILHEVSSCSLSIINISVAVAPNKGSLHAGIKKSPETIIIYHPLIKSFILKLMKYKYFIAMMLRNKIVLSWNKKQFISYSTAYFYLKEVVTIFLWL